jgi:hypothetical protein
MKELKQRYGKLAEKYNLPLFEELDQDFEILYFKELFEISKPLAFVRRRIYDKIGWVCSMIQTLMQPNPGSPISIEEASFFTKEEKQDFIKLLKQMMYFERLSIHLDVESTEQEDADFIKETTKKWKEIKPKIKEITNQLNKGWKKETEKKTKNHNYLG